MNKKSKIYIASLSALIGITAITATSLAVFTDTKIDDTTITAGEVSISAAPASTVGTDGYITTSKPDTIRVSNNETVKAAKYDINNDGTKKAYIRAQIIPVVQCKQGKEWITDTSVSLDSVNLYVTAGNDVTVDSWIYSDGYYYFPNVVNSGDKLSLMIGCDMPDEDNKRVIYDVDIQASQATHNAYAKNWGIQGLPAGVEVLKSNY